MITKITTAFLYAVLRPATAMSRAAEREVFSSSHFAARFWERVGDTGLALEGLVGHVAARCDIDISTHMMDRAYEA